MANIFVGLRREKDIHALQLGRQMSSRAFKCESTLSTYACLEYPLASLLSISASLHLSLLTEAFEGHGSCNHGIPCSYTSWY